MFIELGVPTTPLSPSIRASSPLFKDDMFIEVSANGHLLSSSRLLRYGVNIRDVFYTKVWTISMYLMPDLQSISDFFSQLLTQVQTVENRLQCAKA